MFQTHTIPDKEPAINVGIVLPEDNLSSLKFTSDTGHYIISINKQTSPFPAGESITINLQGTQLRVESDSNIELSEEQITISPQDPLIKPSGKSGIRVDSVKAGRGFHWQKMISVFLPGTIIIRKEKDKLMLVNRLLLEHYVMCVATSEMSAHCPAALIEAQTIAARSWLLAGVEQKHSSLGIDVCNDDCCQRYQGTTHLSRQSIEGALNTYGTVLMYNNAICDARYSKSCGGMMEAFENIWDGEKHGYLQVKPDSNSPIDLNLSSENDFLMWLAQVPSVYCSPHYVSEKELVKYLGSVDEENHYFRWKIHLKKEELIDSLEHYAAIKIQEIKSFKVISRGGSGRITKLQVNYLNRQNKSEKLIINSEYKVRRFLSKTFLFSSAIIIQYDQTADQYKINGAGWGHGVGLCQIGALGMALSGKQHQEIVQHYYPGSTLQKIYHGI